MKVILPRGPRAVFVFTEVAEFIRSLKEENKVPIEEICKSIRISPQTYYPILAGENVRIGYYGSTCYYLIDVLCGDDLRKKEMYYAEFGKRIMEGIAKNFSADL